jgi:uncharacterized protein YqjF (DUF2071 family)
MLSYLKKHPFSVEAFFESSLVLTYALPKNELIDIIPECLELDTYEGEWAFIAVAMVQTKNLRPRGFPSFMGNNFFLAGYRIFVKYKTSDGKRLRGLYILKSETNKIRMQFLGNLFTHYNYSTTDIEVNKDKNLMSIQSHKSDLNIVIDARDEEVFLPPNSPFKDWKQAKRYAGPLPFTFTYNENTKEVLIIEDVRENWIPKPVQVMRSHVGYINQNKFKKAVLANAFIIESIPYYWRKGKIDLWKVQ